MSLTSTSRGSAGGADELGQLTFVRVEPSQRYPALALLLSGRRSHDDPAVDNFLTFAAAQNLSLDDLWAAQRQGTMLAATLIVPCAGRTGMIFVSPALGGDEAAAAASLVRAACAAQNPQRLRLLQGLLDPGQDHVRRVLEAAGFKRLATLIYMQRSAERTAAPLDLPDGLRAVHYAPEHHGLFAAAVLASYRETRDCPGLLGLREIGDVLAGHRATGRFHPELWWALTCGDEPVGVMLLTVVPQRRALELVYLGLSPSWRRRELARRLMRHALPLPPRYGADSVLLAVDENNAPAMRLYRGLGFVSQARKTAMILPLP